MLDVANCPLESYCTTLGLLGGHKGSQALGPAAEGPIQVLKNEEVQNSGHMAVWPQVEPWQCLRQRKWSEFKREVKSRESREASDATDTPVLQRKSSPIRPSDPSAPPVPVSETTTLRNEV